MTDGRVKVGSGTLYNLLDQFQKEGMIEETKVEGRKKSYLLTESGKKRLHQEYQRLQEQILDFQEIFGDELTDNELTDH